MAIKDIFENQQADFAPEAAEKDTREWIAGYPIHPAASLLPLIEGEDLNAMAEDIRQHGLKVPIVLNEAGEVVDGRNRLICCETVQVPPQFTTLNGADALDYVASLNLERRHLNRSQRAMLTAYLRHLKQEQHKKFKTKLLRPSLEDEADAHDVTRLQLMRCNTIIKFSPELISDVVQGRMTVIEAWEEARTVKDSKNRRGEMEAKLQAGAADLWQLVTDGVMNLPDAIRSLEAREREAYASAVSLYRNMQTGFRLLDPGSWSLEDQAEHWLSVRSEMLTADDDFSAERARKIAAALVLYADRKEEANAS